jgi:hypothetical protein
MLSNRALEGIKLLDGRESILFRRGSNKTPGSRIRSRIRSPNRSPNRSPLGFRAQVLTMPPEFEVRGYVRIVFGSLGPLGSVAPHFISRAFFGGKSILFPR